MAEASYASLWSSHSEDLRRHFSSTGTSVELIEQNIYPLFAYTARASSGQCAVTSPRKYKYTMLNVYKIRANIFAITVKARTFWYTCLDAQKETDFLKS